MQSKLIKFGENATFNNLILQQKRVHSRLTFLWVAYIVYIQYIYTVLFNTDIYKLRKLSENVRDGDTFQWFAKVANVQLLVPPEILNFFTIFLK